MLLAFVLSPGLDLDGQVPVNVPDYEPREVRTKQINSGFWREFADAVKREFWPGD